MPSATLATLHTVHTFAVAAIGSLVTICAAIIARLTLVPAEIRANDRRASNRDEDLEAWICDRNVSLRRELETVRKNLAARAALESGGYLFEMAAAKQRALHEWRDQERQARRDVAAIYDRENPLHRGWRRLELAPHRRDLETPAPAKPILDAWRTPPTTPDMRRRDEPPPDIDDPTERTLAGAIEAARNVADYQ